MTTEEYAHIALIKIVSDGKGIKEDALKKLLQDPDYKKGIVLLTQALREFALLKINEDRGLIIQKANEVWGEETQSAQYVATMIKDLDAAKF